MDNKRYWASVGWGPRQETPEQLAVRLIEAIGNIRDIDPLFARWHTVPHEEIFAPLELRVGPVAERITLAVAKDDNDMPNPAGGYWFSAYNFDQPEWTPSGFRLSIHVGSTQNWSGNSVSLSTSFECDPDPLFVSYDLFRRVLLNLVNVFDASFGYASSGELAELRRREREKPRLSVEWMSYLGPRFSHFADPPPSAIVERCPNGGLFMAATNEVFSVEEPEHMAVARDIHASVAPFNALKMPYPGLEWPES